MLSLEAWQFLNQQAHVLHEEALFMAEAASDAAVAGAVLRSREIPQDAFDRALERLSRLGWLLYGGDSPLERTILGILRAARELTEDTWATVPQSAQDLLLLLEERDRIRREKAAEAD